MKRTIIVIILIVGILLPVALTSPAIAGWFGLGEVAKAIGDTAWRIVLINAVERLAPTILLGIVIIGAICSFMLPGYGVLEWLKAFREAIRTGDKVDRYEIVGLTIGALLLGYIGIHLIELGTLLLESATAGLGELNRGVK